MTSIDWDLVDAMCAPDSEDLERLRDILDAPERERATAEIFLRESMMADVPLGPRGEMCSLLELDGELVAETLERIIGGSAE